MAEIHAVINDGDVYTLSLKPVCPHGLYIYVLPSLISQVPLAAV